MTTNKTKLITLSTLDGLSCAVLASTMISEDIEVEILTAANIKPRLKKLIESGDYKNYEKIFITDIVLTKEFMELLNKVNDNFIFRVFGHKRHAMYMNDYPWATVQEFCSGRRTCATELFWNYIKEHHIKDVLRYKDVIRDYDNYVEYVRNWESGDWKADGNINEMSLDLNTLCLAYSSSKFFKDMTVKLANGSPLLNEIDEAVIESFNARKMRYISNKMKNVRYITMDEYNIAIVFAEDFISELSNYVLKHSVNVDIVAVVNVDTKTVSMRTPKDNIDLTVIARSYDGGGYNKCAGFTFTNDIENYILKNIFTDRNISID